MKRNNRLNISGLFAAALLFLAVACVRDPMSNIEYGDTALVHFTLKPEGLSTATRAADPEGNVENRHISDGSGAKLLVYAVYDEDGNLLTEFGKGLSKNLLDSGITPGEGQTYVNVGEEGFPYTIELRLKRNKTYKIAFWAQDPACKFYDIQDLKAVKVHYTEVEAGDASSTPNNDESRDAFCRVETITINNKSDENRTVWLYRPLAQINVGTTGYDYETAIQMKKYAYSRIQIASAARYLDVVNDQIRIDDSLDSKSVLEFGWAPIPAYINYKKADLEDPEFDLAAITDPRQEFLKVHLYTDTEIEGKEGEYMSREDGFCAYAGLDKDGKKTETFKYLSMCYVLVPSDTKYDDKGNPLYERTTIDRLRVWLATDAQGSDEKEIIDISNVHATRNWRTNIVGDILTGTVDFTVKLDPVYAGSVNGFYEDEEVVWSGWLDEYHGAYYDADKDEILISNAGGLLWLQRMVNGDLLYTVDAGSAQKGQAIKYFDENHVEQEFGDKSEQPYFKGIKDPTIDPEYDDWTPAARKELKARILRATHQDNNPGHNVEKNQTWPEYNNFHFVGADENDRANVKLVADIDMSGIEWLGIGFDCKMDQTFDMLCDNGSKEKSSVDLGPYDKKKHRGFFGHFDGNGHTVSNLRTKRFAMDVHPSSMQQNSGGPYEAVQWYARGFFGQLGGAASVENLTLRNVDIHGYHCVGGIAGAAIGINPNAGEGKSIDIINCVVDGGTIENVPMYRGDGVFKNEDRTWARGVNTGGIVGLYNAGNPNADKPNVGGSVDNNRVSNLTINGYRQVGGIVGNIDHVYSSYITDGSKFSKSSISRNPAKVGLQSLSNNVISNTTIIADHFKPFSRLEHTENFKDSLTVNGEKIYYPKDWAYGFSWGFTYRTFVDHLAGGENGIANVPTVVNNSYGDNVQLVDLSGAYDLDGTTIKGRTTDINNVPIELLPVLDNWFVDDVKVVSNLIGEARSYKRYETKEFAFYSKKPNDKQNSPFQMPETYDRKWVEGSGRVGMYVGAITLDGTNKSNQNDDTDDKKHSVLSVRGVTGEKDCAMLISACDRNQFTGGAQTWYTSAATTVSHLSVRGNPYAYTGICLAPNSVMNAITISDVSVYDVYQTLALAELDDQSNANVWPKKIDAQNVTLTVESANLRGYTVPGAGWASVAYTSVIFEKGARVLQKEDSKLDTEYTCQVDETADGTTFTDCTFKAPYIIKIAENAKVTFAEGENNTTTFAGDCTIQYGETKVTVPSGAYKKVVVNTDGSVTLTDMSGQEATVNAAAE